MILLAVVMLCSCKAQKDQYTYFYDVQNIPAGVLDAHRKAITLQPDDELAISVSSEVAKATAHFNMSTADMTDATTTLTTNRMQQTYIVNRDGDIDFPTLGKIHVEGMTTTQLKDYLVERISKSVKDPMVKVSIVNFRVNVLGEVREPGVVKSEGERITLLEALAACQDLSEYGNRNNVMVIREDAKGNIQYGKVDLQSTDLIKSPYYYLQQNDVVYVGPTDVRRENSRLNENTSNRLTAISIIVTALTSAATIIVTVTR